MFLPFFLHLQHLLTAFVVMCCMAFCSEDPLREESDRLPASAAQPEAQSAVCEQAADSCSAADTPMSPSANGASVSDSQPASAWTACSASERMRYEAWPELPLCVEQPNYTYLTHFCPIPRLAEEQPCLGRNYTLCYDPSKRGAWWVAYPLHACHLSTGRPKPDPWGYDPDLAPESQANMARGSYNGDYDRGHQIPNADRNADISPGGMCYQTFYASNSTPQASRLNQRSWADLEKQVRDWICADTLYVVTGACWLPDSTRTTTDKAGNDCPVPDFYFKVLARTVQGDIRQPGDRLGSHAATELQTIGFWVANDTDSGSADWRDWAVSVAEIERRTGFTFFPSLPEAVKQSCDRAAWEF